MASKMAKAIRTVLIGATFSGTTKMPSAQNRILAIPHNHRFLTYLCLKLGMLLTIFFAPMIMVTVARKNKIPYITSPLSITEIQDPIHIVPVVNYFYTAASTDFFIVAFASSSNICLSYILTNG